MNKRVHVGVCRVVGMALLVGLAAQARPAAQGNQAKPDAEFQKLADAFSQAWAKGDAKGIAALHTKDAVRVAGTGEPAVVGTEAIEKALAAALTGPYKGSTLVIKPNQYNRVSADTYVGEGTYEVQGGAIPAGTPTRGQYLNTMVRTGGVWRIAASAVMPAMQPK
ncbi:MAG TPA: SgcJ/EcaC family oxidoreductase [Vicinamibacterales bacterium]|nr:SgcJ/EcaC family oxidoreductase [Vicinamibacterales bacterium]